jgi:RNA recognition motif-containing protein
MNNELFVGNIAFDTIQNDSRGAFAAHDTVTETKLMMNRITNHSRGFGFVTMSTAGEAWKVIESAAVEKD